MLIALALRHRPPLIVRILICALLAVIAVVFVDTMFAIAAHAAEGQVTDEVEPFVHVDTLLLLLGAVTPFVTALIAKAGASDWWKAAISALVTALVSVVVVGLQSGDLTVESWFNGWAQVILTHVVTWTMASPAVVSFNRNTPGLVGPRA